MKEERNVIVIIKIILRIIKTRTKRREYKRTKPIKFELIFVVVIFLSSHVKHHKSRRN